MSALDELAAARRRRPWALRSPLSVAAVLTAAIWSLLLVGAVVVAATATDDAFLTTSSDAFVFIVVLYGLLVALPLTVLVWFVTGVVVLVRAVRRRPADEARALGGDPSDGRHERAESG